MKKKFIVVQTGQNPDTFQIYYYDDEQSGQQVMTYRYDEVPLQRTRFYMSRAAAERRAKELQDAIP